MPASPIYALHDDLYALVVYLHAGSNRDLWANLRAEPLSVSQAMLLDRLRGGVHPTVKQCASLINMTPAVTARVVDDLAQRGYVTRSENHLDRRSKRVALAPRGDQAIGRLHAARLEQIVRFTDELSPTEAAALRLSLRPAMRRQEIAQFHPTPAPA